MIIERRVAARDRLEAIVEVQDHLVERQFVGDQHAVRAEVLERFLDAALLLAQMENRPDVLRAATQRGETLAGHRVPARDVCVIGDNFRDIAAGQAIGATTVGVATGPMTYEDLAKHGPDFLFHDFSRTDDVLEKLLADVPENRRKSKL